MLVYSRVIVYSMITKHIHFPQESFSASPVCAAPFAVTHTKAAGKRSLPCFNTSKRAKYHAETPNHSFSRSQSQPVPNINCRMRNSLSFLISRSNAVTKLERSVYFSHDSPPNNFDSIFITSLSPSTSYIRDTSAVLLISSTAPAYIIREDGLQFSGR